MYIIRSFLIAALVAMFGTPASAQSLYDPLTGGLYGAPPPYAGGSVQDRLNQGWSDFRRQQEQDALQNDINALKRENTRLRALRAQELDRQRRYDPASGIWSPARSR